eukprot:3568278-Pyramimonas_sp.AAC.1
MASSISTVERAAPEDSSTSCMSSRAEDLKTPVRKRSAAPAFVSLRDKYRWTALRRSCHAAVSTADLHASCVGKDAGLKGA